MDWDGDTPIFVKWDKNNEEKVADRETEGIFQHTLLGYLNKQGEYWYWYCKGADIQKGVDWIYYSTDIVSRWKLSAEFGDDDLGNECVLHGGNAYAPLK